MARTHTTRWLEAGLTVLLAGWLVGCAATPAAAPPPDPAEVARVERASLERRCEAGNGADCLTLAERSRAPGVRGGVPPVTVTTLYRKACDAGDAVGCHRLALATEGTDPRGALRLMQIGCSRGLAAACGDLAAWTLEGRHADKDVPLAMVFLRKACKGKHAGSCRSLATLYSDSSAARHNPDTAYGFLRQACEYGDAGACAETKARRGALSLHTRGAREAITEELYLREVSCDLQTRGSLAMIEALKPLGQARVALERCVPGPTRFRATWAWEDGRVGAVTIRPEGALAGCIRGVISAIKPPMNGRCQAELMVGHAPPVKRVKKRKKRRRKKRRP